MARWFVFSTVTIVFLLTPLIASSQTRDGQPRGKHEGLVGKWRLSKEINEALGFAGDGSRDDSSIDHPTSFELTLDKKLGASMPAETVAAYREQVFSKFKHRIVATGQWKTTFDVDHDLETNCFITENGGETFVWVPAPFVVIFGGKISYLKGNEARHDVIVIDFHPELTEEQRGERSDDTVAYRRQSK